MILTTPDPITQEQHHEILRIFNSWINGPDQALIIGNCKVSITAVPAESIEVRQGRILGL